MDCDEIRELLDAYSLGAAEDSEAAALEEHVADCVRCWEELSKSQQTAALLALAIPIQDAPESLEDRILAVARREEERATAGSRPGLLDRLKIGWPATAGAFAVVGIAALAFAAFLQFQLSDIRSKNDELESQVVAEERVLQDIREIMTIAVADDLDTAELAASAGVSTAGTVIYGWSRKHLGGFIMCRGLPPLEDDMVYQAWFSLGDDAIPAGTFESHDGTCQIPVTLDESIRPTGVGITAEPAGGSEEPGEWLMYADFTR